MNHTLKEAITHNPDQAMAAISTVLVELVYSDGEPADVEWVEMRLHLATLFDMDEAAVMSMLSDIAATAAEHEVEKACEYINLSFNIHQKGELIMLLWRVAYADDKIAADELKILRNVAESIGLSNEHFAELRNTTRLK